MTEKTNLLPCPFCGNAPVVRRCLEEFPPEDAPSGDYEIGVTICCTTCGIEMSEEYRSEVVEAWNRRAMPPHDRSE